MPVLLGYSLGKAQEILCALLAAGLTPMLHGAVYRMTRNLPAAAARFSRGLRALRRGRGRRQSAGLPAEREPHADDHADQEPPRGRAHRLGARSRRDAIATKCDAAFPLTDHADYPDLLRYVELVQPQRVLTLHGFAAAFARDLRERGSKRGR